MNEKISIMELQGGPVYNWAEVDSIWAKGEVTDKTNLFSRVGLGAKTTKFTLRRYPVTLHNAIKWRDRHYFISHITDDGKMNIEVTTSQIEPRACIAKRTTTTKDELNRPVLGTEEIATFPGYLIEKYQGYYQQQPQAVSEVVYVLVTPKIIVLEVGDLVQIEAETYNVQIPHMLDEYKNEYEIALTKDV